MGKIEIEIKKESLLYLVIAVLFGLVAFNNWQIMKLNEKINSITAQAINPANTLKTFNLEIGNSPVEGNPNAPVAIIEFADFQCPYCKRHFLTTLQNLTKDYINTGKVKYVFKHLVLSFHQYALPAANAAECAKEQGKFWEFHNLLYSNSDWLSANYSQIFREYVEELGLNVNKWANCYENRKYESEINKETSLARELGATGTPTFFIMIPKNMLNDTSNFEDLAKNYPRNFDFGQDKTGKYYVLKIVGALPYQIFDAILREIQY